MLKYILVVVASVALSCVEAPAATITQVVFSITSSAQTATPNLRVAKQSKRLTREAVSAGNVIQGPAPSSFEDYYLTKSQTVSLVDVVWFEVQVDQDTKMYLNSDLDNHILVYSATDKSFVVYK